MKGELEWKVGKWAGVPVRPGIAHWERRERLESKEREMEVEGEGKGSEVERKGGKVMEGDEEIEQGISTVAISQGEKLEQESPPHQVDSLGSQDLKWHTMYMHQGVEKTELEKAAVAEKKEWLKEEEEGEPLMVSITLPQVCSKMGPCFLETGSLFFRDRVPIF